MVALACAVLLVGGLFSTTLAQGSTHTVRSGDTLYGIARQHGVSVADLASANSLGSSAWVYVGQVLTIPTGSAAAPSAPSTASPSSSSYTVRQGDTLYSIAVRHATTIAALKQANGLSGDTIFIGQVLSIPGAGTSTLSAVPPPPYQPYKGEKWIDVNLTYQTVTAYEGATAVYRAIASTGLPHTPTVTGTYSIYVKYLATDMTGGSRAQGDYYYLEDVPYTMYFFQGYGLHGTYWHSNFGQPMSRGCVNLSTPDAEWFYEWANIGTKVVSHY